MDTNTVRRAVIASAMAKLNDDDLDPADWAGIAGVVVRALNGHDNAQPPVAAPDELSTFLDELNQIANTTGA
jgi:hypothetical protein